MYLHPDGNDLDDLTVMDASDPSLGLTNIGDIPADDWAADTGPTHSAEEEAPSHNGEVINMDKISTPSNTRQFHWITLRRA